MTPTNKRNLAIEKIERLVEYLGHDTVKRELLNWMTADDALQCLENIERLWEVE